MAFTAHSELIGIPETELRLAHEFAVLRLSVPARAGVVIKCQ